MRFMVTHRGVLALLLLLGFHPLRVDAQRLSEPDHCIFPEQRRISTRSPEGIWPIPPAPTRAPPTVAAPKCLGTPLQLALDDAIRIALSNAEVIRVLGGSSGRTVYDPAIVNSQVDVQRSSFDPQLTIDNFYRHNETYTPRIRLPGPVAGIDVAESDAYNLAASVTQRKVSGTQLTGSLSVSPTDSDLAGVLDPQTPTTLSLGAVKPLLRGANRYANRAPIVIARLDTEQSYYQLKDSVQEMIRGVIEGYWAIVAAKVNVWATRQQIEQLEFALNFFEAQQEVGRANAGETAQTQVSLANFRASLISAEANLLNNEAVFRNLLGLPPAGAECLVPVTPPLSEQQSFDWESLVAVAEQHRPDLIQLKLQIEADEQRLLIADVNALPTVNAVANQSVRGLAGKSTFTGDTFGRFGAADVQVGLQVAFPWGLRADRANLRAAQISLSRDRAILRQQLHSVRHSIAQSVRNLEQFYAQYEAFKKVREAARVSLDLQFQQFRTGRTTYLNVLRAVTDWGNAVSSEANALASYNIELAGLKRQVGTIIEDHGVRFYEDQFGSQGPRCDDVCYPESIKSSENQSRYETGDRPSEDNFDLESQVPETGNKTQRRARHAKESDADRARRLRESLGAPQTIEPLQIPPLESPGPGGQLPRPAQDPGPAPVKPAESLPLPPDGKLPGDDMEEALDRLKGLINPFRPDEVPPSPDAE